MPRRSKRNHSRASKNNHTVNKHVEPKEIPISQFYGLNDDDAVHDRNDHISDDAQAAQPDEVMHDAVHAEEKLHEQDESNNGDKEGEDAHLEPYDFAGDKVIRRHAEVHRRNRKGQIVVDREVNESYPPHEQRNREQMLARQSLLLATYGPHFQFVYHAPDIRAHKHVFHLYEECHVRNNERQWRQRATLENAVRHRNLEACKTCDRRHKRELDEIANPPPPKRARVATNKWPDAVKRIIWNWMHGGEYTSTEVASLINDGYPDLEPTCKPYHCINIAKKSKEQMDEGVTYNKGNRPEHPSRLVSKEAEEEIKKELYVHLCRLQFKNTQRGEVILNRGQTTYSALQDWIKEKFDLPRKPSNPWLRRILKSIGAAMFVVKKLKTLSVTPVNRHKRKAFGKFLTKLALEQTARTSTAFFSRCFYFDWTTVSPHKLLASRQLGLSFGGHPMRIPTIKDIAFTAGIFTSYVYGVICTTRYSRTKTKKGSSAMDMVNAFRHLNQYIDRISADERTKFGPTPYFLFMDGEHARHGVFLRDVENVAQVITPDDVVEWMERNEQWAPGKGPIEDKRFNIVILSPYSPCYMPNEELHHQIFSGMSGRMAQWREEWDESHKVRQNAAETDESKQGIHSTGVDIDRGLPLHPVPHPKHPSMQEWKKALKKSFMETLKLIDGHTFRPYVAHTSEFARVLGEGAHLENLPWDLKRLLSSMCRIPKSLEAWYEYGKMQEATRHILEPEALEDDFSDVEQDHAEDVDGDTTDEEGEGDNEHDDDSASD